MSSEMPRPPEDARKEFLLKMYDQMFNDINTHILVVWQSVGVLVGAFAIFALAEKGILSIDVATTLIVLLASWLLAHLQDASYWYNRNLVIIANIERQFLVDSDLRNIHYYFGEHRPQNRMISHLQIQYALGVSLAVIMLLLHFVTRVVPGFSGSWSNFDPQRALPYGVSMAAGVYLARLARRKRAGYAEFVLNSPGAPVNTEGITYGVGHGFRPGEHAEPRPADDNPQT
jgi:hypothetical protein